MNDYKLQAAELIVRLFVGILFLFQGYDKLFKVKISGVINTFTADAERSHIPHVFLSLIAYFTSIAEFVGGIFLLLGFCVTLTLYTLGLDLLLVCLAFTYMRPMWDMKYVFPRLILIVFLLLIPENYSFFSLDHLLQMK
jgi:putative oxidoreductase